MEFMPMLIKKSAWIRRRFLQAGAFCRVRKKEEQEEKQVKESLPRAESQCSSPSSFTRSGEPHEPKSEDPEAEARKHVAFSFRFFILIFCAGWGAATSLLLPDSDEGVGGEANPLRQQLQQSHPVVQTEGADKTHTFKHTHEQTLSHTYTQQRSKIQRRPLTSESESIWQSLYQLLLLISWLELRVGAVTFFLYSFVCSLLPSCL